jgi:hypothetical protein
MQTISKFAAAAALAGAMALTAAVPSQARPWHHHGGGGAAALGGFIAGAAVGTAAAAASGGYYGPGYYDNGYDGPGYAPGYAYQSDDAGYAYGAAPAYADDSYAYAAPSRCWITTDGDRGFGYYGSCAHRPVQSGARVPRNEAH